MFPFVSALGDVFFALLFLAGVYVYISLVRQISARRSTSTDESARRFGLPEAILAALLILWFLLGVFVSVSRSESHLSNRDLVVNLIFVVAIVLIITGFLRLRGFDLDALGGFSRIGIVRAMSTGAVLLLAAWPLLNLADAITQRLLGSGSSKQSIIELFNSSQTIEQRIMIIVFAVAIAPLAEEFLFRFFIYSVLKRYCGLFLGLIFSGLLFAAAHTHLPSFAPLFVLGICFALAFEWSGSILVPMAMHSLFNSLQLVLLAFPQLSQR
jgi:membrane protease YdiL (CAAX protease family)